MEFIKKHAVPNNIEEKAVDTVENKSPVSFVIPAQKKSTIFMVNTELDQNTQPGNYSVDSLPRVRVSMTSI